MAKYYVELNVEFYMPDNATPEQLDSALDAISHSLDPYGELQNPTITNTEISDWDTVNG